MPTVAVAAVVTATIPVEEETKAEAVKEDIQNIIMREEAMEKRETIKVIMDMEEKAKKARKEIKVTNKVNLEEVTLEAHPEEIITTLCQIQVQWDQDITVFIKPKQLAMGQQVRASQAKIKEVVGYLYRQNFSGFIKHSL